MQPVKKSMMLVYKPMVYRARVLVLMFLAAAIVMTAGCENRMHTQRGSVSGIVKDTVGNAVKGAMVTSHRSLFKAETDKNGNFTFTSLDVGSHRLTVNRNGYFLASRTIELGYGQVLDGINISVEPFGEMISLSVLKREKNRLIIDVSCLEPMSVWAGWREKSSTRLQTKPTQTASKHEIELAGLFPDAEYLVEIEGVTADGRKFVSSVLQVKTVSLEDLPGAPPAVSEILVTQNSAGPVLSWKYEGLDPLKGFRVYRGSEAASLRLKIDEKMVFASQTNYQDTDILPGRQYYYGIEAVDLEGNVSSMSQIVSIVPAGKITEDITWTRAMSPVNINGDLTVPAGNTLTIEPGVTVLFSSEDNAGGGFSPTTCEMIVEGTVIAEGSADQKIRFISASSTPGRSDWEGIRVVAGENEAKNVFSHVLISGADKGLTLYSSNAAVTDFTARFCRNGLAMYTASGSSLVNLLFEDCDTGLLVENTWYSSASNVVAKNCRTGVLLAGNSFFSLDTFDVRSSSDAAIRCVDRQGTRVRNGLLQSFKTGLVAGGASANYRFLTIDAVTGILVDGADLPVIRNCIIVNRFNPGSGYGIEEKTAGRSYPYNNIFGFRSPTFDCDQLGATIINADPRFSGGSGDDFNYRLRPDSPVIAAADNGGQMGAYGSGN